MKKHLVALVLCVMMLLGCTAARAEDEYLYYEYETTWFSEVELDFDVALETCRNSDRGVYRALVALFSCVEYNRKVENAYEPDFSQPIYVSAFSRSSNLALVVDFFSEDGHHVRLFTDGQQVAYNVDTEVPSVVKTVQTLACDWTYEISSSDLLTVAEAINQN